MTRIDLVLQRAHELVQNSRVVEAVSVLESVVQSHPNDARASMFLGWLLLEIGRPVEALTHLDRVLGIDPLSARAHALRALALRNLKQLEAADAAAQRGVALAPGDAEAHSIRAKVLIASGNMTDAADAALEALRLNPDLTEAAEMAARALMTAGLADRAVEVLTSFLAAHPDEWNIRCQVRGSMSYAQSCSPNQRTGYAIDLGSRLAARAPTAVQPPIERPDPDRPIRIGYLAQDISEHSAITYFIEQVFACHDEVRYPLVCYLTQPGMGVMTRHMRDHLSTWTDVSRMSDPELVERVRKDTIDILVELAGRTPGHRILALLLGPAPITISAIGDPETSGLPLFNYRIVDSITDPPGCEAHWTEKLIRLPGCFLCYRPPDDAPPARTPRPPNAQTPITFGSLNILPKTGPDVIALWSRILQRVPDSRLLLKAPGLAHPRMRTVVEARFAQHGIGPERLTLLGRTRGFAEHLRTYDQVDIALDPFPYNGTTTSCEALWMGVPMVTLLGQAHAGRVGASLLTAVGLASLIAPDEETFVGIAADLANDPARLSGLHSSLRTHVAASILCDGPAHARALEGAFRAIWRSKCAEQNSARS